MENISNILIFIGNIINSETLLLDKKIFWVQALYI